MKGIVSIIVIIMLCAITVPAVHGETEFIDETEEFDETSGRIRDDGGVYYSEPSSIETIGTSWGRCDYNNFRGIRVTFWINSYRIGSDFIFAIAQQDDAGYYSNDGDNMNVVEIELRPMSSTQTKVTITDKFGSSSERVTEKKYLVDTYKDWAMVQVEITDPVSEGGPLTGHGKIAVWVGERRIIHDVEMMSSTIQLREFNSIFFYNTWGNDKVYIDDIQATVNRDSTQLPEDLGVETPINWSIVYVGAFVIVVLAVVMLSKPAGVGGVTKSIKKTMRKK